MATVRAILFRLAYQLQSHRWNGWRLSSWLSFALVLLAGLASLDVVRGGRATVYGAAAVFLILWGVIIWASRNRYVLFRAEDNRAKPGLAAPLTPADRIEVRATGSFEVEGKKSQFSDLQAYFRTFATREHAVMAIVPPSRFLFLGSRPREEIGMWYIFIHDRQIIDMAPGKLRFGLRERPALRVVYREEAGAKIAYLSFDDHSHRQRVWAGLDRDAAGMRQVPQPDQIPLAPN